MAITKNIRPIVRIGQQVETTEPFNLTSDGHRREPLDLTNATSVEINVEHYSGAFTAVNWGTCTISDPRNGEVEYTFTESDTTTLHGDYYVQFRVQYENGESDLVPPEGYEWIIRIGRKQPNEPTPLEVSRLYADEATIGNLQVDNATIAEVVGDPEIDSLSMNTLSANQLGQNLNANGFRITNVPDPQDPRDFIPQEYADTLFSDNYVTGTSNPATADYDANNYSIRNADVIESERSSTYQVDSHSSIGKWGTAYTGYGKQLDNFEDLTQWTVTDGTLEADTVDVFRGSQSALLKPGTDSTGAETQSLIQKSVNLDLTDKRFAGAFKLIDGTKEVTNINIICDDANGNTMYMDSRYAHPNLRPGWRYLNFGYDSTVDPGIDLANITNIRIHIPGGVDETRIAELKLIPAPDPGVVMFGFDDGNVEDYTFAKDILSEYGFTATTWVNTIGIRDGYASKLSVQQCKELEEEYGWHIGSHLHQHNNITQATDAEARALIEDAKKFLQQHGFHEGANHMAYPYNDYDQRSLELSQEYHLSARTAGGFGIGWPLNPMLWPGQTGDDGVTADLQANIDFMAEYGGVGEIFFHSSQVTEANMRAVLDYVANLVDQGDLVVAQQPDFFESRPPTQTFAGGSGSDIDRHDSKEQFEASGDLIGVVNTPTGSRLAWNDQE